MELENIQTVASLCCGVIGYSWALKFAMGGHEVYAYNRSEESSARAKVSRRSSSRTLAVASSDASGSCGKYSECAAFNSLSAPARVRLCWPAAAMARTAEEASDKAGRLMSSEYA